MRTLFIFLITAAASHEALPEGHRLQARAEPAVIELEPLADNLRYLRLPDLAFDLRIEPQCASVAGIRSVLVSVADTRVRHEGDEFTDSGLLQTTLVVPRPQAGVLRVDGFCRDGDAEPSRHRINEVFTARLSLRCADDDRESIAYATLPLDIVLECRAGQMLVPEPAPAQLNPP